MACCSETWQPRGRHCLVAMVEVKGDIVAGLADAAAFAQLHRQRAGDDGARRQVLGRWGIALHEALTLGVRQIVALAARALGNENARTIDAGGMELDELHVLQRKARDRKSTRLNSSH